MKRLIPCIFMLTIFMLSLSSIALADDQKEEKIQVCHVNSANDIVDSWLPLTDDQGNVTGWLVFYFQQGRVIEVSSSSVPAHLAHGDRSFPDFFEYDDILRDNLKDQGYKLPNGNCAFMDHVEFVPAE